jgi:long-chain-fatty-acid--[acyl-carrier-protein] ligase
MKFLAIFYGFFLRLRYKLIIKGIDEIKGKKSNLFLPNHQAEVDPQLVMSVILRYGKVAPMISAAYYNLPILKSLFKLMGAVSVPDFDRGARDVNVMKKLEDAALTALKADRGILLYPSGQLAGQGYERIFNKQSAYEITRKLPEKSNVIGVRISGLLGSIWSRAWTGKSPDFFPTYLKSVWFVIANLFFFLPRRTVVIEFKDITKEAKEKASTLDRRGFNTYLEEFYNIHGEEKPLFLKHYFYAPRLKRQLPQSIAGSDSTKSDTTHKHIKPVPENVLNTVRQALANELKINPESIEVKNSLIMDLNLDSLGLVSVITDIEKEFPRVKTPDIEAVKTVYDLCLMAMGENPDQRQELKVSTLHISNEEDYNIMPDPEKNILEHFIKEFNKNKEEYFAWDNVSGTSQRGGFFLKTAVVSQLIRKKVKGKHVGIMLPALQSTTLLVAATYMAGKIPVMLNWTVGHKVLSYCADITNLEVIITAGSFYDKVKEQIPADVAGRLMFLEKEVEKLSLGIKLSGVLKAKFPGLFINTKLDETAVILFTSGSETNPKAVPLTHKNIIADLWGALHLFDIRHNSIFLSFLPPFHSFGFSVLSVLPLITSFKIAYTPNPTDVAEVVRTIRHTRATHVMVTPTFLKMIMAQANKYDLRSIELVISGAESLPKATKEKFEEMTRGKSLIIEGYGITECSPIVSLNPIDKQKTGSVGKFIKGLDHRFINPETGEVIPDGKEGMIVVSGESVFGGYLDKNIESPFIEIDGKRFYKTGDLAYTDNEGFIYITGRLKRFIKAGGEMISMPMIEKILLKRYGEDDRLVLAVEGDDSDGNAVLALFTVKDIDLEEVNNELKANGVSGLARIHRVIRIDEIPRLGSGKTDYKILKKMVKEGAE